MDADLSQFSFMDFDLFEVAKNECYSVLNLALENLEIYNFDVNSQDKSGNSLLHYTAENGNVESTVKLLSLNAFVNILNEKGESPLHAACLGGHLNVAKLLVENGANINALDYFRELPVFKAVRRGEKALTRFLLSKVTNIKHRNKIGENLLHMAVIFGDKCLVEMLLDEGMDPDVSTGYGETPIELAIKYNFAEIAKLLLSRNITFTSTAHRNGYNLLHLTAIHNSPTICEALIASSKLEIDGRDQNGCTPLHLAAERNFINVMKILLENKADINAADEDGYTPLHLAANSKRNGDAVEILLRHNAKVDVKTVHGDLPLHRAAACGNEKGVILLFSRKYIINKNNIGLTPTQMAIEHERMHTVQLLKNFDADENENNISSIHNDTFTITKNKSTSIPVLIKAKK